MATAALGFHENAAQFTGFQDPYTKGALAENEQAGPILSLLSARPFDAARKGVGEVSVELAATKEKLSTAAAEQQTQFSGARDTRATEFAAAQNDRQTKHAAAMSEFQTAFSNAQNERQAGFTAGTNEQQTKFAADQEARNKASTTAETDRAEKYAALHAQYTSALEEYSKELTRLRESATKAAEEALASLKAQYEAGARQILEKIEEHKTQVEKLVGVIGNLGVTSGYQITAKSRTESDLSVAIPHRCVTGRPYLGCVCHCIRAAGCRTSLCSRTKHQSVFVDSHRHLRGLFSEAGGKQPRCRAKE